MPDENEPSEAERERARDRRRRRRGTILWLVTALVVSLAIITYFYWWQPRVVGGDLLEAHFIQRGDAPAMLLVERSYHGKVGAPHYKMDLVDLVAGTRILRQMSDGVSLEVFGHGEHGPIWLTDSDLRLHARDPLDLHVLSTARDIEQRNPQIQGGIREGSSSYRPENGGVTVESRFGDHFAVDPTTLAATPFQPPPPPPPRRADSKDEVGLPDGNHLNFQLASGGRYRLARENASDTERTVLDESVEYDSPVFLFDRCTRGAVRLTNPNAVVVAHTMVRGDFSNLAISRVGTDGSRGWTWRDEASDQGAGEVLNAHLAGNLLFVAVGKPGNQVVALSVTDGTERWRYRP